MTIRAGINTGALAGGLFSGPGVSASPIAVRMIVPGDGGGAPVAPIEIGSPDEGKEAARLLFERLADCAVEQFGLRDIFAAAAVIAGQPKVWTRAKFRGAVPRTSPASLLADRIFGNARLPRRLPTITGIPFFKGGLRISSTIRVARFVGRAVPVIGEVILAFDAISIVGCVVNGEGDNG